MDNSTYEYKEFLVGEHGSYQQNILKEKTISVLNNVKETLQPLITTINDIDSLKVDVLNRIGGVKTLTEANDLSSLIKTTQIQNLSSNLLNLRKSYGSNNSIDNYEKQIKSSTNLKNIDKVNIEIAKKIEIKKAIDLKLQFLGEKVYDKSCAKEQVDSLIEKAKESTIEAYEFIHEELGKTQKREFFNISSVPAFGNVVEMLVKYEKVKGVEYHLPPFKEPITVDFPKKVTSATQLKSSQPLTYDSNLFDFVKEEYNRTEYFIDNFDILEESWMRDSADAIKQRSEKVTKNVSTAVMYAGGAIAVCVVGWFVISNWAVILVIVIIFGALAAYS